MKLELRALLPKVLKDTGYKDEASLNATIGSKHDDFFDLKHDVIPSSEQFVTHWLKGFNVRARFRSSCSVMNTHLKKSIAFKKYLLIFLRRSYLKHYGELARLRPHVSEAILWIGQENASYGIAITPRFTDGEWENDKSEIRAFKYGYWTIGHVMSTGLVIPGKDKTLHFADIDQYLIFFTDTLVRNSGSGHEYEIAELYAQFVKRQVDPYAVPLLIPEYRYGGLKKKHRYRLDFLIINPYTLDKFGFELSPWSTHGYLRKTKSLTQAQINDMAKNNFENEMERHREFFQKKHIYTVIYTDRNLRNKKRLFETAFVPLLQPERPKDYLSFKAMEEYFH
jgi:hypothetical protein